jgi:hypothetical protein
MVSGALRGVAGLMLLVVVLSRVLEGMMMREKGCAGSPMRLIGGWEGEAGLICW